MASFPHTRGDGPLYGGCGRLPDVFSPHAWGWSVRAGRRLHQFGVFPTRVGMVRPQSTKYGGRNGFPHTRGDGPECRLHRPRRAGFSPHAWGWSATLSTFAAPTNVFPTRVGMVRVIEDSRIRAHCFPHTRGDGPPRPCPWCHCCWFSPHAWGWSEFRRRQRREIPVFPTRVGMVRTRTARQPWRRSFPHTRGDGPASSLGRWYRR